MKNLTFNAMSPKVKLPLNLAAVACILGITFNISAAEKGMTETECKFVEKNSDVGFVESKITCSNLTTIEFVKCIANAYFKKSVTKMEFEADPKVMVCSKYGSNTVKVDTYLNSKKINANSMPMINKLNPSFKRTRLI